MLRYAVEGQMRGRQAAFPRWDEAACLRVRAHDMYMYMCMCMCVSRASGARLSAALFPLRSPAGESIAKHRFAMVTAVHNKALFTLAGG